MSKNIAEIDMDNLHSDFKAPKILIKLLEYVINSFLNLFQPNLTKLNLNNLTSITIEIYQMGLDLVRFDLS